MFQMQSITAIVKILFFSSYMMLTIHASSTQKKAYSHQNQSKKSQAETGLENLYQRVAQDAKAGKPIVVQVHVALCDNSIIACGAQGNGDDITRNLYWTTSEGLVGWMKTTGKKQGWNEIYQGKDSNPDILQIRVYQKQVLPGPLWKKYGLERPFSIYLVANAWRGKAIDEALTTYFKDLYQNNLREIQMSSNRKSWNLSVGGNAHLVAFIGHNRLMDLDSFDFNRFNLKKLEDMPTKGFVMMACHSASYLAKQVSSNKRVPLLLTKDFVFASAPALETSLRAFVQAEDLARIWIEGATGYAEGEGKTVSLAKKVITNPADPNWHF